MTRPRARPDSLPGWPRALSAELAAAYTALSITALYSLAGFPAPIHLSPGRVAWLREDLDRWLDGKAGRMPASAAAQPGSDWDDAIAAKTAVSPDRPGRR